MTSAQIKSVSLFFFYSLLDEDLAQKSAKEVIELLRPKLKVKTEKDLTNPGVILIHQCMTEYKRTKQALVQGKASLNQRTRFLLPPGVNIGAWRQLRKEIPEEEFIALIWSQVVGFDDSQIAQGLGITEGTVRYRVGRGLRHLGQLLGWGDQLA